MHAPNFSLIAAGALLLFTPIVTASERDNLTYDPQTCYSSKYEYLWLATCSDIASSGFNACSRSVGLATMAPGARNCGCEWVKEQAACDDKCASVNPITYTGYTSIMQSRLSRACGAATGSGTGSGTVGTTTARATATATAAGATTSASSSQNAAMPLGLGGYGRFGDTSIGVIGGFIGVGIGAVAVLL